MEISDTNIFNWAVIPLLIFLSRVADVSIGTIRIITVSRGIKLLASILGFFEVLIWLIVVTQILQNLTNPIYYIAYAGGFAAGNYVGIWIEQKLSIGKVMLRVITNNDNSKFKTYLNEHKYRYTSLAAKSSNGEVEVLLNVVSRKQLKEILEILNRYNPNAFYTIEDIRQVNDNNFPPESRRLSVWNQFTRRRTSSIVKKK
jgi:uncharacterized protein YebE (UPF0316 family)